MATKKKKRKSSYSNEGFDMKSLGALLVIIIGVALIIVLVHSMDGNKTAQEADSDNPSAVNSEVYNQSDETVDDSTTVSEDSSTDETTTTTESQPAFTVTVKDLDGKYSRTNVESANAATLKISSQDSEGFDFSLSLPDSNYAGYAEFVAETTAQWTYDGNVFTFECASGSVTVSGFKAANGKYITGEPTYTDEPESDYDSTIINASSTRSTLSEIMSGEDYSLLKKILSEGNYMGVSQNSSEYQTDKNGVGVMVDKQTGMIKYQYELQYEGKCMVLCSTDSKVCVGIYNENDDTGELRYYASTSALRSEVPDCIRNYASAYDLELVIC